MQAEKLQKAHPVNLVLCLDVPAEVILDRVKNRWVHLPSGRVYNVGFNSPKVAVSWNGNFGSPPNVHMIGNMPRKIS